MPSTKKPSEFNDENSVAENSVNEPRRKRRAIYYTSNTPDSYIKNAQSGYVYPYKVGSLESLQLYKVIDTSGTIDENGLKLNKKNRPNKESNILYYDNPEEYIRHRGIKINNDEIIAWKDKVKRLFTSEGKFNNEEWKKLKLENYERYNKITVKKISNTNNHSERKRANSGLGIKCVRNNN